MVTIINYGLGNISAFVNAYRQMGVALRVACHAEELHDSTHLILPGVGSFDHAMEKFSDSGMREVVTALVFERKVPILGVCVGMQMLSRSSEEGSSPGLGWIDGTVRHLSGIVGKARQLPHMGWNDIAATQDSPLLTGLGVGARFYFLHSYYFVCDRNTHEIAAAEYGSQFACAISRGNIYGVQFHPEKSHHWGRQLLSNFATL
jgi:glutamine amidotransferase